MKKFISNFVYQSLFQVIKLLAPIITIPIVSHNLGASNIGIYSFLYSITSYFILFAGLGMQLYGQRTISRNRDSRKKLSVTFWKLFKFQVISSLTMFFSFIILAYILSYTRLMLLMSLMVLSVLFDISWFFMGIENFRMTSLRSISISILTLLSTILFVNDINDLSKYVVIQSVGLLLSQVIMWPFLKGKVDIVKVEMLDSLKLLPEVLTYFLPQIGNIIMGSLVTTILGIMQSNFEVAYYANSMLLVSVINTIISTVDTVLLPKMSYLHATEGIPALLKILDISLELQIYFTVPAFFGLILVSKSLIFWFFGSTFIEVSKLLPIVAPIVILTPLSSSISRQYLLPIGKLRDYNISVFMGAICSTLICLLTIDKLGSYGAALASVTAQLVVLITRLIPFTKETGFKFNLRNISIYVFAGVIFLIIGRLVTSHMPSAISTTMIQVFIGSSTYLLITTLLKSNALLNAIKNRKIEK